MNYQAPRSCPVCGHPMEVTRLHCNHCQSELTGHFQVCRFCLLPEKEMHFLETFLRCRGSIKDVERAMGISYPTVRNLLDTTLRALGLDDGAQEAEQAPQAADAQARRDILDQLEKGEIDASQAAEKLKDLRREQA